MICTLIHDKPVCLAYQTTLQCLFGLQSPDLREVLASICNDIRVEGSKVCQAFTWDDEQKRGYFKGQHVNDQYNLHELKANSTMCNSPSVTTWILNVGMTLSPGRCCMACRCLQSCILARPKMPGFTAKALENPSAFSLCQPYLISYTKY